MLQTPRPTPTCAHFRVSEMPCAKCGHPMRLILTEPRSARFELMTYRCIYCETAESFLMAIEVRPLAGSALSVAPNPCRSSLAVT